jgi:RHS repeat-associated protein
MGRQADGQQLGRELTSLEITTPAFDPNGAKTQVSVLNGPYGSAPLIVTQTSYDALNHPICTAERNNAAVFGSLPAACSQSTNGSAGPDDVTQLTYDLAGQKLIETRGVGTSIAGPYATYTYGGDGEVLTILDNNTNLTTNLYDGLNRLAKVEYPMPTLGSNASNPNDAESYSYDANGNRLTLTKRDGTTTIAFTYDTLNRMSAKSFAATATNVMYAYDLAGRPLASLYAQAVGNPGVNWAYDAAGRRIGETTYGRALAFAYDSDGNPSGVTWPDAVSVPFAYDAADRFSSAGTAATAMVTAGYDSLSRVNALTRQGGANTSVGYDAADRMASLAHSFTNSSNNESWTFGYTPVGQLASEAGTNSAWDWNPGASAPVNTTANGLNQNAAVGSASWTYDHNGNLTSDGTRSFTYDAENRLLTVTATGVSLALSYDPTGRLQQTVDSGTTTQFLYDGDALVGEYPASGTTPLRRYVHGPAVDNPFIWYEGGTVTAANANYLIADRQGSVVATANTGGNWTKTYIYDPYGVPATWGSIGTDPRFRYTGQAMLPSASLYYYKARAYDPASGKFLQTDPIGYGPDVNWYAYVGNDPVDRRDPSGKWCMVDLNGGSATCYDKATGTNIVTTRVISLGPANTAQPAGASGGQGAASNSGHNAGAKGGEQAKGFSTALEATGHLVETSSAATESVVQAAGGPNAEVAVAGVEHTIGRFGVALSVGSESFAAISDIQSGRQGIGPAIVEHALSLGMTLEGARVGTGVGGPWGGLAGALAGGLISPAMEAETQFQVTEPPDVTLPFATMGHAPL